MPRRAPATRSSSSSSSSSSSLPLALCTLMPGFVPPLFQTGQRDEFTRSGKTLALVASPRDDSVAVYASANARRQCCVTFASTKGICFLGRYQELSVVVHPA